MSWQTLTVAAPSAVSDLASLFDTLKTGLETMLNFAKTQAQIAKVLAGGANASMLAIEATLDSIISDIGVLQTGGVSAITAHPYAHGINATYDKSTGFMGLTPSGALNQIDKAFDDEGDSSRPTGVGAWGALVIVLSVETISELYGSLEEVGLFFNMQKIRDLSAQIEKRWQQKQTGTVQEVKLSTGLDFYGISQAELFPLYHEMLEKVKDFALGAKGSIISSRKSLDDVVDFIDDQLAELTEIVDMISAASDSFLVNLAGSGVYYQYFPKSSNTIASIRSGLLSDHPSVWGDHNYSMVLGFFGSDAGIQTLGDILGL
jgi:hypothetical protein